jgi:transcriptional regulator GlxA family with amidase domain
MDISGQDPATLYVNTLATSGGVNVSAIYLSTDGGASFTWPLEQKFRSLACAASVNKSVIGWTRERASRARRSAGVCTGAFVLGEAGLPDQSARHDALVFCKQLASRYRAIKVPAVAK